MIEVWVTLAVVIGVPLILGSVALYFEKKEKRDKLMDDIINARYYKYKNKKTILK